MISIIAYAGHHMGNMTLTSWSRGRYIDMKPTTCVLLALAGAMTVLMTTAAHSKWRETLISTLASVLGGFIFSQIIWYRAVSVDPHEVATTIGSMQSLGTTTAIILLAACGWWRAVADNVIGAIVLSRVAGAIGAVALVGYVLSWPRLYWEYPDVSNPIAIPTAVCLGLCAFAVNGREQR